MKALRIPTDALHASAPPAMQTDAAARRQPALDALTTALEAVNGTATAHTYARGHDIRDLAMGAEARLASLGIPAKARVGAELHAKSGDVLPTAYANAGRRVIRTVVALRRATAGWTCTDIRRIEDYPTAKPRADLRLTSDQDARAVAKLRATYSLTAPAPQTPSRETNQKDHAHV